MKIGDYIIEEIDDENFRVVYDSHPVCFSAELCAGDFETLLRCLFMMPNVNVNYEKPLSLANQAGDLL